MKIRNHRLVRDDGTLLAYRARPHAGDSISFRLPVSSHRTAGGNVAATPHRQNPADLPAISRLRMAAAQDLKPA